MSDCDECREDLMPHQEVSTYHRGHRPLLIEILNLHNGAIWSDISRKIIL